MSIATPASSPQQSLDIASSWQAAAQASDGPTLASEQRPPTTQAMHGVTPPPQKSYFGMAYLL